MRAMRLNKPKPVEEAPLELVDLPVQEPGAGMLRLRVKACGVCHTDLHIVEGDIHPPHLPITPGHQVVGIVDAIGEELLPAPVQIGDRVGVPWLYWTDGTCGFCRRGEQNLCPNARFTGFDVDGGFADYMLAHTGFVLSLPESIPDEAAAPLLCAGIIGYRSLRQADLQPGERLGLIGFGASAHLAIQVARYWGCEVYVFTRAKQHRQHALELGAAWAGGLEDEAPSLVDRAIIFAPSGLLVPTTLEKIRPGGTLAINAVYMSDIPQMPYRLIYGERTLRSVANATYQDGVEFLQLAAEIPVQADTSVYPLEDANRALVDLKYSKLNGEAVLVM